MKMNILSIKAKAISYLKSIKRSRIAAAAAAVVILLAVLLANTGCFSGISGTSCVGLNSRSMGILTDDTTFRQYFVPLNKNLSYIEVKFATYTDETAEGFIHFSLLNGDGKVLAEKDAAIKDLQDDAFYRFDTNVKLDTSETYSYTLRVVGQGLQPAPVVWVSRPSGGEETSLVLPQAATNLTYQANAQFGYTYFNGPSFAWSIVMILLCGLVILLPLDIPEKRRTLAARLLLFLSPVAMFFLAEDLNGNSAFSKITPAYLLNYVYYLLIYLVLFALINRLRVSMLISNTIIYAVAIINYFKLLFRGEPLQPWDFFAAKTALNVSSSYSLSLSVVLIETFLFFLLMNLVSWKVNYSFPRLRRRIATGVLSAALSVLMVFSLFGTDRYAIAAFNFMQKIGIVNNVWNQTSNYAKNGLVLALTMNAQYMNVDVPEGYSAEAVADIKTQIESGSPADELASTALSLAATPADPAAPTPAATPTPATADTPVSELTQETVTKPNIIAIMCESYADLSCIADFTTNMEVTPNYDSLSDNAIKGTLYVSTYGGGTANSEFEFLTGNSMAFLPNGSIPYQQYIENTTGSLARILKSDGYETVAVHPYQASGWNRTAVYQQFGFDQFLSMEDFAAPSYMRGYISDQCSYEKLIELYENKPEGQPIFLFNVTMQNHGGYSNTYANFNEDVKLTDYAGQFPETEQYLSLIRQSDIALQNLISYFAAADEPTVICFFGDHLPNLKNDFYETILGKKLEDLSSEEMLKLYQTPFLIWANYDIGEQEIDHISANYLSTLLLQTANIDLPDYNQYLSSLYQSFPVINSMAVFDSTGNIYGSPASVPENKALTDYSILEYNNLFDKTGRDATLFDSASPASSGEGIMITGLPRAVSPSEETGESTAIAGGQP